MEKSKAKIKTSIKNENELNFNISESQIEYKLYLLIKTIEPEESSLQVNKFYQDIIKYVEQLSHLYIWNNEKFQLRKPVECNLKHDNSKYYICNGSIDFGDNLEDEWFIVFILIELTHKFSAKLAAQVQDSDGEFLLIHSADYLPNWASSAADDCMKNRVFIYNGQLHIIPPATNPSLITYLPATGSIEDSVSGAKIVFDFSTITLASEDIQKSIKKRISLFESDKINLIYHKASCTIPAKLTWLLKNNPALISLAINSFCEKDPKDLKLCRQLDTFKPIDLVNYRVTFTKHLYGKLKYCDYKPEKRHNWPSINKLMSMDTSIISQQKSSTNTDNNVPNASIIIRERSSLGFKLTCAFEILFKKLLNDNDNSTSKSFDKYLKRLCNLGYFKDYIENSKSYNDLMEKAKQSYFNNHNLKNNLKNELSCTSSELSESNMKTSTETETASEQNQAGSVFSTTKMSTESSDSNDLLKSYSNKLWDSLYLDNLINEDYVVKLKEEICSNTDTDDNDDWLCVEAPNLDDYLEMYSKGNVSSTYDFNIITNAFKKFLQTPKQKTSLLEGAEYKPIEKNDEKLIDLNVNSIQTNLKDILSNKTSNNKEKKLDHCDNDDESNDYDEDDENDSFYEVDDDVLDENDDDTGQSDKEFSDKFKNYMDLMDLELKGETNLARLDKGDLEIDLNLVSNALESYSSQLGLTGPVSNILKSIGL